MKSGKRILVAAIFLLGGLTAVRPSAAQTQEGRRFGLTDERTKMELPSFAQPQGIALESTIDPEKYYVGPSDVFSVNVWMSPPLTATLSVTPEGTLIVPTVGEIKVSDLTLAEAKRRVKEKIRSRYNTTEEPTVTLVTPRPIIVWVRGNVMNPGSYQLWAFNRADQAIEAANKLQVTQEQYELRQVLSTMSTRNITIKHKDGTSSPVDISKFMATKDDQWNPTLREGDLVVVPRKDLERSVIGVYGEVNVPGRYEYVRGDSVKDVLRIAQGFTSEALRDSLEFFRVDASQDTMWSMIFNGDDLLSGIIPDIAMEPGDRIVVRARPDIRADFTVEVTGEVLFPGIYPITRNRTMLSEIVQKAGGFTEFASIKTAELLRSSVRPAEVDLERLLSLRGGVRVEDSLYYYLETDLRLRKEIVNVDFDSLFVIGDSTQDVVLQDGDVVRVPSRQITIYVFGQVSSPGHIPYAPGADIDYYLRQAGGFTERARPDDIQIVKARTRQWLAPDATIVEEGDYIWVPKEIDRSFAYYMAIAGQTAAIISVALSIVLITLQIGKQ